MTSDSPDLICAYCSHPKGVQLTEEVHKHTFSYWECGYCGAQILGIRKEDRLAFDKDNYQQSRIPDFLQSLDKMREVHIKKNQDYSSDDNPFSNFDASEYGLRMFSNPRDGAFVWPIFTKLARLATLLNSGNKPNNESIEDSFIDIANYVLLWKADYLRRVISQP